MPVEVFFQIVCENEYFPNEDDMKRWVEAAIPSTQTHSLNIRLVSEEEIQQLNKQFRKKEAVTDILSFPFEIPTLLQGDFIGDIVLCPRRINRDAEKQHKKENDHWAHLIVHGTLHLLGYEHDLDNDAEKMMTQEIYILSQFHIPNPYEI